MGYRSVRDMPRRQQKAVYADKNRMRTYRKPNRETRIHALMDSEGLSRKEAIAELKNMGEY